MAPLLPHRMQALLREDLHSAAFDPIAASYLIRPEIFHTESVRVCLDGYGATTEYQHSVCSQCGADVAGPQTIVGPTSPTPATVRLATSVNAPAYVHLVASAIQGS